MQIGDRREETAHSMSLVFYHTCTNTHRHTYKGKAMENTWHGRKASMLCENAGKQEGRARRQKARQRHTAGYMRKGKGCRHATHIQGTHMKVLHGTWWEGCAHGTHAAAWSLLSHPCLLPALVCLSSTFRKSPKLPMPVPVSFPRLSTHCHHACQPVITTTSTTMCSARHNTSMSSCFSASLHRRRNSN